MAGYPWGFVLMITVMLGGFALLQSNMNYLHSDTKQDMNRRFTEQKAGMDKRFDKIETEQKEQRKLLLQILQKR